MISIIIDRVEPSCCRLVSKHNGSAACDIDYVSAGISLIIFIVVKDGRVGESSSYIRGSSPVMDQWTTYFVLKLLV